MSEMLERLPPMTIEATRLIPRVSINGTGNQIVYQLRIKEVEYPSLCSVQRQFFGGDDREGH